MRISISICLYFFVFLSIECKVQLSQLSTFTDVKCNSSDKTCKNVQCNVQKISKNLTTLNFRCDLQKQLNKFKFNFVQKLMKNGNYETIIDAPNVVACNVMENIDKFPMFSTGFSYLNMTFPGLFHKCPYKFVEVTNASIINGIPEKGLFTSWQAFPNGEYKATMKIADDSDDNIVTLTYFVGVRSYRYEV